MRSSGSRPCPPSALSLLGLVRHMAAMERQFRMLLAGEPMRGTWAPGPDLNLDGPSGKSKLPRRRMSSRHGMPNVGIRAS
jgi:hypothetical protein